MASVISSSPLFEGFILLIASCIFDEKIYIPTRARFEGGISGFSISLMTLPSFETSATPNCLGLSTSLRRISASGELILNSLINLFIPIPIRLSPKYMINEESTRKSCAVLMACASPPGTSCVIYWISIPQRLPSPTVFLTSWPVSGEIIMPTSFIPA